MSYRFFQAFQRGIPLSLFFLLTLLAHASLVLSTGPKAADFLVKGHSLPGVSSHIGDLGDSWAGKVPISSDDCRSLFFWLWPPSEGEGDDTHTIWLQGGPGASGLKGLLQEMGPFLLPTSRVNTSQVARNEHSLTKAGWLLAVDQPAGVGLSDGPAKAKSAVEAAKEFTTWLLNLVSIFPELKSKKLTIVGESYGSQYAFHIADHIFQNTNLKLTGLGIISGILTDRKLQQEAPLYEWAVKRQSDLHLSDATMSDIKAEATSDGIASFVTDHLHYPPKGPITAPSTLPDSHSYLTAIAEAVSDRASKGCLNIYNIMDECPLAAFDPLGNPPGNYTVQRTTSDNWINNTPGFREAIHAGNSTWRFYQSESPFVGGSDESPFPMETELFSRVVERMERVVISAGLDDMSLTALGAQLALQSATWRGKQGFQAGGFKSLKAGGGGGFNGGKYHTEDKVTLALVKGAGHEIPMYQPEIALKLHRFLLGQIDDLDR
ncbi:alpha/beta-hydrolase [Microstroma glucosiphilum]|uniref:Carboxypeptidase n=1 Tax=Pseudomicrostroma glucosiphilum TaxID=1684307 RepID=A0A316UEJ9_9BASI|nr:alpha/beta-hydrolase [Pseudomicrostroma glucosiphilum]PWN23649.1 alpha/beta-hydrolase [Pseudomicrostroma glucosiphilum]